MRSFAIAAVLLAAFAATAVAELVYIDPLTGDKETSAPTLTLIHSQGAISTVSFFYKGADPKRVFASSGGLASAGQIITSKYKDYKNYTVPYELKNNVGTESYKFSIEEADGTIVDISGRMIVAGFVIMDAGKVVSGDSGAGITVGQKGTYSYDVKSVGVDGATADLSGTKIEYVETVGQYMKEVKSSSISSSKFTITIDDYRVGSGSFRVLFEDSSIERDGETFETILYVKQETNPIPPCVVKAGEYKLTASGSVAVAMYNLEKPPQATAVKAIVLSVGGKSYNFVSGISKRVIPDQTIYFRPEVVGEASITCDGVAAKVVGAGGLVITGTPPKPPTDALAVDGVTGLPNKAGKDIVTAIITVKDSDPNLLTLAEGKKIVANMCSAMGGESCVMESVKRGSAILSCAGYVEEGDTAAPGKLEACYKSCECQKQMGYGCDEITLGEVSTVEAKVTSVAPTVAGSVGLATWTIVLIAVVGAFAIILLVMLALWAVYRRNAEQSESDYSSSGPLGVPDPSDLLYEQSIVRDIYGRGDFPEGGPTPAAAAERAREADLREEFPRPPSSSGVSRGAATDDASSTYSV